ncbi:hypothetical protein PLESTB_000459500 [Pleodorina starrii]|uniref:Enhancer of polycomb-like protein n=1 Tax=Pleodorina starrii TaxID=330485 RepID=A0A9W6BFB9_9CHLO|nr:hypothetical protein PLESTM_000793800 [Pleodorina starrii]GLC51039.1 hypothetical protein PLESTB_000459500 [Pleodorina starrii]
MATRTSIRPRPVDILRQLNIVRDVAELDKTDDLDAAQNQAPAAAFEQPPAGPQKKKKEVKEIPVPEVRIVPGYTREYLPLFRIPDTYIRGKGGVGWARDDYCEYDLDNEDEDWLEAFNGGGANRLSEEKFEQMLWRLETANAEANQRLMSEPGYATDWRMLPAAVAATGNMSRDEALSVLRKHTCARDPILHAVYDYWRGKRERLNKPVMRRLQAPTNPSDTNPYNVFRPRERVNRPQTRRRRENTQDCLDKMRQIRESMLKSLEMTELLTFREARKRDIHRLEVDMQRYQLARHHQPRHQLEAVEAEGAARLQETAARSRQGEARLRAYLDSAVSMGGPSASTSYDCPLRRALLRKRRRQEMEGCVNAEAVGRLPPPPLSPDDEMLILFTPDFTQLLGSSQQQPGAAGAAAAAATPPPGSPAAASANGGGGKPPLVTLPQGLDLRCVRPRVSRCGRTMLTRCDPLTLRPHSPTPQPGLPPLPGGPGGGGAVDLVTVGGLAARHPLLHSAQLPSLPWAASLDLDLLPEGIADKAALRAQRERRLNADRLNVATLRQTQQTLQQQAAGGMVGAASVAGAAAAAAAAAAAPPAPPPAAAVAAAPTGAAGASPALTQRPPPPPAVLSSGAPAGTLPHIPAQGAPSGTLPHVPPAAAPAAAPPPPPPGVAAAATPQPSVQPSASGQLTGAAAPPGSVPLQQQQPAPGSAGGQARKVQKVAGAAAGAAPAGAATPSGSAAASVGSAAVVRSPAPGAASVAAKQGAAAGAGPGSTPGGPPALAQAQPTPQPASSQSAGTPVAAATPVPTPAGAGGAAAAAPAPSAPPTAAGAASAATAAAAGAAAATPPGSAGGATPTPGGGTGGSPGTGPTAKKLLSASKAVAGPSSSAAAQLKRGPGRPPKAAKATPNGDAPPPSNTTVPMDML